MKRGTFFSVAILATVTATSAQADTARQALLAVGQIDQLAGGSPGDVAIVRRAGQREEAVPFRYLFDGDELVLRGSGAVVTLLMKGSMEPVVIEAARQRVYRVSATRQPSIGERLSAMLARFDYLFSSPATTQTVTKQARGDADGPASAAGQPSELRTDIDARQLLPAGALVVSPVWSGPVTNLRLVDASGATRATASAIGKTSVALPIEADMTTGTLIAEGADGHANLRWTFSRAGDPPRVNDLADAPPTLIALWLATEGLSECGCTGCHSCVRCRAATSRRNGCGTPPGRARCRRTKSGEARCGPFRPRGAAIPDRLS